MNSAVSERVREAEVALVTTDSDQSRFGHPFRWWSPERVMLPEEGNRGGCLERHSNVRRGDRRQRDGQRKGCFCDMADFDTELVAAIEITRGDTVIKGDGEILEVELVGPDQFADNWVEIIGTLLTSDGVEEPCWDAGWRMPMGDTVARLTKTVEQKRQRLENMDRESGDSRTGAIEKRRRETAEDPVRSEPIEVRLAALRSQMKSLMLEITPDISGEWPLMTVSDRDEARAHINGMLQDMKSLRHVARMWEVKPR